MRLSEEQFNYIVNGELKPGTFMVGDIREKFLKIFPIKGNKDEYIQNLMRDFQFDLTDIVNNFNLILTELDRISKEK